MQHLKTNSFYGTVFPILVRRFSLISPIETPECVLVCGGRKIKKKSQKEKI
jgi:hypothetical protein